MILKCKNVKNNCPNVSGWDYTGTKKYPTMVNCPGCGNKVRVPKEQPEINNMVFKLGE